MAFITKKEEGLFLALFNRDGYVLNFNDSTFNAFTASSIGEALKQTSMPFADQHHHK